MDLNIKSQIFGLLAQNLSFSSVLEAFPFVSPDDLKKLMKEAEVLFSQDRAMIKKEQGQFSPNLESIETLYINIDGASYGNPGRAAAGAIIRDSEGEILTKASLYLGETTNNVAEYQSLILALKKARSFKAEKVVILSDSLLLIKQMCGDYRVKDAKLRELHQQASCLLKEFKQFTLKHIPREENREADLLASSAALEGGKVDRMVAGLAKRREESPSSTEQGAG